MSIKTTGRNPSGMALDKLKQSPNYKSKGFENFSPTPMMLQDSSYYELLLKYFKKEPNAKPSRPLPSVKTNLHDIGTGKPSIVWFGHSSYLINFMEKRFLIDPVMSGFASPVSCMVKAFDGADAYTVDDLPPIDYLVITHDHYDHLDYKTIMRLKGKVKHVYTSLGVGSHLIYWGFDAATVHELDWWQSAQLENNITITATPARHFSGRGFKRFKTFWSSFVLNAGDHKLFVGGDSGYDSHFREIGERFGGFDIALLESVQYNSAWPLIHMMPEETVKAAIELKSKTLMPVHWGKFTLAMHAWNEPVERVLAEASKTGLQVTTPMIGEAVTLNSNYPNSEWWRF